MSKGLWLSWAGENKMTLKCHFMTTDEVFLYEREAVAQQSEFRKRVTAAQLVSKVSLQARSA